MDSRDTLPTADDLRKLSHRALVAYVARRARRIQPIFWSHSPTLIHAVDQAVTVAEKCARAVPFGATEEARKAHAVAKGVMDVTGRSMPKAAATRAFRALMVVLTKYRDGRYNELTADLAQADVLDDQNESWADYGRLADLSDTLPRSGPECAGIDFDQLGPLWPNGPSPSIPTEHVRRLRNGIEAWNQWRQADPGIEPDLSGLDLVKDKETRASVVDRTTIRSLDLSTTNLEGAKLADIKFEECNFRGANLGGAALPGSRFTKCFFYGANLGGANISAASFHDCQFSYNTATSACSMAHTVARGTRFVGSNLRNVDLRTIRCDEATKFERVEVAGARISRQALDRLKEDGGLTLGQRREMFVADDVATLRQSFSGVWNRIHFLALAVFFAPYVWFLAHQWMKARVGDLSTSEGDFSPILLNLVRFIVSGGDTWRDWQLRFVPILLFGLAVLFNFVRGVLWVKTMSLEHHRAVQGHYPTFNLSGWWKGLFRGYKVLAVIALFVLIAHTWMFLMKPVPM